MQQCQFVFVCFFYIKKFQNSFVKLKFPWKTRYSFLKLQNRDYILHVLRQRCARFMHIARCAGALHILHYYKDSSYMDGTLSIANFHLGNETRLIIFNLIIHHKIASQNQLKFIRLYFIPHVGRFPAMSLASAQRCVLPVCFPVDLLLPYKFSPAPQVTLELIYVKCY